jgi:peptide/nickel transport system permease protein
MLADGRGYIRDAWWLSTFPGLAIVLLAAAVNFIGDAARDALDPRFR